MKIHTFIRDSKKMEQNEREAIAKREKFFKRQQRTVESTEQKEAQETASKSRKKKNKKAV